MSGPCVCGDPYCPRCGDPERAKAELAAERLADTVVELNATEEEVEMLIKIVPVILDLWRIGVNLNSGDGAKTRRPAEIVRSMFGDGKDER